jgi:hypothetical protein
MRNSRKLFPATGALLTAGGIAGLSVVHRAAAQEQQKDPASNNDRTLSGQDTHRDPIADNAQAMLDQGKKTFRFDTFGDEAFWGDTLKLHQALAGARQGGVGAGVSPQTALSVGLKAM